jgi:hypothetical protein
MTAAKSGGGINSRVVKHTSNPKQEPVAHAVSVGAVSRLGNMVGEGTPFKPLYSGPGYSKPVGPTNNMGVGPGANREVMRSGSQGQHGSAVAGTPRPGADAPVFPGFPGRK